MKQIHTPNESGKYRLAEHRVSLFFCVYRAWAQQKPLYKKESTRKHAAICIAIIEKTDGQGLG